MSRIATDRIDVSDLAWRESLNGIIRQEVRRRMVRRMRDLPALGRIYWAVGFNPKLRCLVFYTFAAERSEDNADALQRMRLWRKRIRDPFYWEFEAP